MLKSEKSMGHRSVRRIGRAFLWWLCVVLVLVPAPRLAWAEGPFVVIVHAANPVSNLKPQAVSDLFLKKSTAWPDGTKVTPVDLSELAPVREAFSKSVHGKSTASVKAFWQKMIFSGREVPPPEKVSPEEVVAYVRANRGAVGYVPAGTALGAGVKAVAVSP